MYICRGLHANPEFQATGYSDYRVNKYEWENMVRDWGTRQGCRRQGCDDSILRAYWSPTVTGTHGRELPYVWQRCLRAPPVYSSLSRSRVYVKPGPRLASVVVR